MQAAVSVSQGLMALGLALRLNLLPSDTFAPEDCAAGPQSLRQAAEKHDRETGLSCKKDRTRHSHSSRLSPLCRLGQATASVTPTTSPLASCPRIAARVGLTRLSIAITIVHPLVRILHHAGPVSNRSSC